MAAAMMQAGGRGEELWWSLYDPVVVDKCSQQETDLQGIAALLGITFSCFKRLKAQHDNTKHEYELTKNRLQVTLSDLSKIEGELKSKNEMPCDRCRVLEDELTSQKKKVLLNEERMKSIARILNLGGTQKITSDGDSAKQSQFAYACSVVSQMLSNETEDDTADSENQGPVQEKGNDGENQKQGDKDEPKVSCENKLFRTDTLAFKCFDMTLVPETLTIDAPKMTMIIPETVVEKEESCPDEIECVELNKQATPKKQLMKNKSTKENRSPVIGSSVRQPARACKTALADTTRNGTADKASCNAPLVNTVSPSLLKDETMCCEVPEKRPQLLEGHVTKRADKWVLKPSNEVTSPVKFANKLPARKLTQTRLSLARVPKKVDVCSTQEFSGGVQHTSTLVAPKPSDDYDDILQKVLKESLEEHKKMQENEDIVLESPKSTSVKSLQSSLKVSHGRSRCSRPEPSKRSSDPDETFFPCASRDATKRTRTGGEVENTEQLLAELGAPTHTSPDLGILPLAADPPRPHRVPDKRQASGGVNYIYQRDTVRGKVARRKLEGWACNDCRDLYEGLRLSEAEKKALMNECSKHRDNFPARSTSPSDW